MSKRLFSILAAGALIASAFTLAPAKAQPEIPSDEDAQILDEAGDANVVHAAGGPSGGVNLAAADIVKGWFTHDNETISAHLQTTAPGPGTYPVFYRIRVDPGTGSHCLWFTGWVTVEGSTGAGLRQNCDGDSTEAGEFAQEEGPEETGIHTMTFPRSAHPALADGSTLRAPWAETTLFLGTGPTGGATAPQVDLTEEGKDYTITAGDPGTAGTPPGKNDPPGKGKKKGCPKGKGKKKGACPGKKAAKTKACGNYQPGELGAEAETIKLNEKATEEDPAVYEFELDADFSEGLSGDTPEHFVNVQLDTKVKTAGLYALFEFPTRRDYDLWAYWPSGNEAASAHGFNLLAEASGVPGPFDPSNSSGNHAGETTDHSEALVGVITPRCGGYTLGMYNYFGEGGNFELKLWLGEGVEEPKEDEGG